MLFGRIWGFKAQLLCNICSRWRVAGVVNVMSNQIENLRLTRREVCLHNSPWFAVSLRLFAVRLFAVRLFAVRLFAVRLFTFLPFVRLRPLIVCPFRVQTGYQVIPATC
jgi:hypothetical protein